MPAGISPADHFDWDIDMRFIMHSDHSIPFGVSDDQYRQARQRAQEIFEQSS